MNPFYNFIKITGQVAMLVFFFSGCNNYEDTKKVIFSNSLESIYGWNPDTKIIRIDSHSGRFSAYADSNQVFNLGFRLHLKDISMEKIFHVRAKVWANCSALNNSSYLVMSLLSNGENKSYSNTKVENFTTKTGTWFGVECLLDLPKDASPEDELVVYVMNQGKDRVLFDDMEIEAITIQ
jgi:hypothetical protein